MKRIFSILALGLLSASCFAQEVLVTPSQMNGWQCATFGPSGATSATYFLGSKAPWPQIGNGAVWFYTGNGDGIAYAETNQYQGISLSNFTQLSYCTYTPFDAEHVAPTMNILMDTNRDGKGDTWFEYSPTRNASFIPRDQWITWNTFQGKWWNNQQGGSDERYLGDWLMVYPNATIQTIRIQAGTWSQVSAPMWRNTNLGADWVQIGVNTNYKQFNFEPDSSLNQGGNPSKRPQKVQTMDVNGTANVSPIYLSPAEIFLPFYYMYEGREVRKTETVGPDKKVIEEEKLDSGEEKIDNPYKTEDSQYIPLTFDGNTTIQKVLEQITEVGNPDPRITGGGAFLFGNVPFYIPKDKNNAWDAFLYQDDQEHRMVVKANLQGVTEIHTIMNVTNGTLESGKLFVEFRGSAGAFHRVEVVTNRDIRDWHQFHYNTIVEPSHVVWARKLTSHEGHAECEIRLDSQVFKLPAEFADQELQSVTIVDKSKHKSQRVFLVGVTAKIQVKK